jgi:hypothetical protein
MRSDPSDEYRQPRIGQDLARAWPFWSHNDPVTVFGALMSMSGWGEVGRAFEWLASRFSNGSYDYEVTAAGTSETSVTSSESSTPRRRLTAHRPRLTSSGSRESCGVRRAIGRSCTGMPTRFQTVMPPVAN